MQTRTPKLLEDIRDAASYIRDLASARTLEDYEQDRMVRQAIERNFEIIGEAVNRLAQHDPETAARIGKHRRIVDYRAPGKIPGARAAQGRAAIFKCPST